jgi:hypothetical protein
MILLLFNNTGAGDTTFMFYSEIRQAIETQFKAYWDTNGAGVPVKWDNVDFDQPDSGIWIATSIMFASGEQSSIGTSALETVRGDFVVQIFSPLGSASDDSLLKAGIIGVAMRWRDLTVSSTTVTMYSPSVKRAGAREDFAQWNVSIPFEGRRVITRP